MSHAKMPQPLTDNMLADRLGLTVREFQRYYRQGLITVTVQSDDGAVTVVCRLGNRVWEGVIIDEAISFEQVRFLRGVRSRSSRLPTPGEV